jgi:hypothetical protein
MLHEIAFTMMVNLDFQLDWVKTTLSDQKSTPLGMCESVSRED